MARKLRGWDFSLRYVAARGSVMWLKMMVSRVNTRDVYFFKLFILENMLMVPRHQVSVNVDNFFVQA
jgi:hypothetical protein